MRVAKLVTMLMVCVSASVSISGCGMVGEGKKIIHISNGQPMTHPVNVGLQAFKEHVESELGDKYEVKIYPNELLGATSKAMELLQTGAIEYVVANTSNLETFDNIYQIFSIPYLFDGQEGFYSVMADDDFMTGIYESTDRSGFRAVTWYDLGVRNFYVNKPVHGMEDMKGMKIRVQPSPTNVRMIELLGAAAVPMGYGEVYSALQQGVIDGAENSEMALTTMQHGEVAPYLIYDQHQIMPDLLVCNLKFLNGLSPEEREVFDEAARISTQVEVEAWEKEIQVAKEQSIEMGVEFIDVDMEPFREAMQPLHGEVLDGNPKLKPIYDEIQAIQKMALEDEEGEGEDEKDS